MHEELPSLIRENLVPRRADQFQFLADLVKTPPESSTADMAAVSDVTTKALKELELGVEQHGVSLDDSSGLSGVTNLVVRHEFAAGPVMALVTATRKVSETGDYTQRVAQTGEDELGALSRAKGAWVRSKVPSSFWM